MKPHATQMVEYRVVDANNMVQSRGVLKPLGPNDLTINLPRAIPKINGPFRLDFYADANDSGGYDGIGSVIANDHAWRIDPLADYPVGSVMHVDGLVQVTFVHNTSFTDIDQYPIGTKNPSKDTGLGARIHIAAADAYGGKTLEARVAEAATGHVVCLHRVPELRAAAFEGDVPGCVEMGVDYDVTVYVDANGNGTYDDPATGKGDVGWKTRATSDASGLDVTFDLSRVATGNVDVGAP
jgi:hypothetical protein